MKKIYLDYNVFLDILERNEYDFTIDLKNKGFVFFYSPAHIEEVARGVHCGKIKNNQAKENLSGIHRITDGYELLPHYSSKFNILNSPYGKYGIQIAKESTLTCYKRVYRDIGFNTQAEKSQKNNIIKGQDKFSNLSEKERENALNEINKLDPLLDILEQDDVRRKLISSFISLEAQSDVVDELIDNNQPLNSFNDNMIRKIAILANAKIMNSNGYYDFVAEQLLSPPSKCYYKMKGKFSFVQNMVDAVINELMEYGYKLEGINKAVSSLHDNSHAIYATACDYFICRDGRLISKTTAAYRYLGINTVVIDGNIRDWWTEL
ncbi:hypothetical protein [Pectobacterium brasiliense]|uniref:hypothetical protein n=1 Tax=Pectobacterium brasiliense TaxID=180957 RepID=UPI001969836D|nr:hypothetical protein [Pectobacterium brasiliense]MBN3146264.1 hypothetical protein [Pectobacterium brasiliense]